VPKLSFPGGVLVGCEAGLLNGAKIKGIHTAIKSGMLAAESIFAELYGDREPEYPASLQASWVTQELRAARNFSPGFARFGTLVGAGLAFVEHNLLRGRAPYTLRNRLPDYAALESAAASTPIDYPVPDGVISFDRLSSVYLTNTHHEENQPNHLKLRDAAVPIRDNLPRYAEPAQRYCPAAVYEIVATQGSPPTFQINAQNCIH
jgi:electron-transferring-flavoprotein dehydrogenase